ncbi:HCO3 transporter family-domain-containing protein [Crepidotus variabilis]|uniref:HCO3 transporter family-domain-containing protein n=1 Tax=Crepidotus variabilis TaxID=179855 RepID=A0A9P6JW35_9AGAR|nr:HCO3 transporter family-domain-containing protein [Crepidotus variabilis]
MCASLLLGDYRLTTPRDRVCPTIESLRLSLRFTLTVRVETKCQHFRGEPSSPRSGFASTATLAGDFDSSDIGLSALDLQKHDRYTENQGRSSPHRDTCSSYYSKKKSCLGRSGIILDIRARAPWYISDWKDAWNYRVIPATALIFFSNVLPGIAFSLDLIEVTQQYGVSEVLLSSFMASFVFSVFGAQPLTIAGVTGPITVFNQTIYKILQKHPNPPNYLHFVGWVYLWGAIFHWVTAILNWCNFLKYVTLFSCDTFGFYVSWVYLQYGVQVLTRQFSSSTSTTSSDSAPLVSLILALLMVILSSIFHVFSQTTYFHRHIRRFLADYGMPISLIATSGMAYWGRLHTAHPSTLPVGEAFKAAAGREWLVKFWELDGMWVGIAFPFGIVLWILFFFDHNVSSLMAQGAEFPLKKPPGFHYDFFLLGITTFIAGLLGIPAPNGLIPQAPIHTTSLLVMGRPPKDKKDEEEYENLNLSRTRTNSRSKDSQPPPDPTSVHRHEIPIAVVEQRLSNLAQGSLCLVLLTGPFLHVLSLIPRGVLAGLFWYMGASALLSNGITRKLLYLIQDRALTPKTEPLHRVRKSRIVLFVGVQLIGFGATFGVTQTIAAIGFPVIIMLLLPLRTLVIPRMPFTSEELAILDGPTASPFTMESVGGTL